MSNYGLHLPQECINSVDFVDVSLHFRLSFESKGKATGVRHSGVEVSSAHWCYWLCRLQAAELGPFASDPFWCQTGNQNFV